jgi:hypothetical protein
VSGERESSLADPHGGPAATDLENKLEKHIFSAGKYFYRTYVKLKVGGKYVVDMIKY